MNVKDVVELDIIDSGMDGEGVARLDGKVVFVPYTLVGERVRAVVKSVKKNYLTASVIKVLSPSPHRVTPACPHYYKCGGCDTLHIDGKYRREALVGDLKNNLKKIAGIEYSPEFVAGDGARNKLSMPFGLSGGKTVIGMYRHGTHTVEPVDCGFMGELTRETVRVVLDAVNRRNISVYDEKSGRGLLRHLVIREIGGRASATLVVNGDGIGDDIEREIGDALQQSVDFFVCPNTRRNNVVMGDSVRLVKGEPRLPVNVLGVRAMLSPLSFFQVNDSIRDKLYEAAISCVNSPALIDLYSGIGITSNLAAKKCEKVIAVEVVPQAVEDADATAELNGNADKIRNICGTAEDVLPDIAAGLNCDVDVLVDPPRKGCGGAVMTAISNLAPKRLVYVSCNHATMCRDVRIFIDECAAHGDDYEVCDCRIFDMFPQTHHVETLFCLSKRQPHY